MEVKEKKMYPRIAPRCIYEIKENEIFVFGSNLEGFHGGGAAYSAYRHFGAEWGVGAGPTGHCYAIPTMHGGIPQIAPYVRQFIDYAREHPELKFLVTRIGCGIAGFTDGEIAPLFKECALLENVYLPQTFWEVIER